MYLVECISATLYSSLFDNYTFVRFPDDERVSMAEYFSQTTGHEFMTIIFLELDYDGDGYIDRSAEYGEYSEMDTNGVYTKSFTCLMSSAPI